MFNKAYIPYKGYYSTPFSKWQGSLQNDNAIDLGAKTSKRWFESKGIDPKIVEYLYLGITVGQHRVFFGATWPAVQMGAPDIPGMTVMQACSTATTSVFNASASVEVGNVNTAYCLLVDRCSNSPHTVWPNPMGPGGKVIAEDWFMDNVEADPATGSGMLVTAENVARQEGFTREEADELTLRRYEQYAESLADDRAFQKRFMFPVEATVSRKETKLLEEDEGIAKTSREALARLKPVAKDGIHTFGAQTHPADGNVGILVTSKEKAAELSADPNITIQVVSYGFARAEKAYMPTAPYPAAQMALERAGKTAQDMVAIKNHNPFIANDLYLAKKLGIDANSFNNYGSSIVWGHPQAPTAGRLMVEGIEEAVIKGGGYVLVSGCAAGDTAAAIIFKIS
ncbi:MAG: thiolase family protein [Bacillota bacterium]|nr:thiolase family protein [Bacillota bacterium]